MPHSPHHLDRLRLRHLRLLELIETHRSLRAVADQLGLTQPAVSQMVKDLEFAFGATLVERSVRGVELTGVGRLALQRSRSGLAAFHTLAAELDEGLPPVLQVGTNPAMMFHLIPAALKVARREEAPIDQLLCRAHRLGSRALGHEEQPEAHPSVRDRAGRGLFP